MPRQGINIYKRKDGRWEGRYPKERVNGKIRYGYVFGKTYEEAESKLKIAKDVKPETEPKSSDVSFDTLSTEWLGLQQPELKASSYAKYANMLKLYLHPRFGQMDISAISRYDVQQFSKDLLTTGGSKRIGLAPKTVNSVISVLKMVFDYARKEKSIQVQDICDVTVRQHQKPMRILSCNEQSILSEYLCNDPSPCNLGILLCLYTGMRIGEVCALKWGDICFADQYLFIHQSMQRIQQSNVDGKKTKVVVQSPKSGCSVRRIPIPNQMLQLLLPKQAQDEAFLLTGMVHSYMEPRSLENQFKAVISACGISNITFHALRHTFATRCIELGFDVKSLSEILGHASVNITLNRYVHPSMELKRDNMNLLASLLTTK